MVVVVRRGTKFAKFSRLTSKHASARHYYFKPSSVRSRLEFMTTYMIMNKGDHTVLGAHMR